VRAEHLNRQLVLVLRWGIRGLPYPSPSPAKKAWKYNWRDGLNTVLFVDSGSQGTCILRSVAIQCAAVTGMPLRRPSLPYKRIVSISTAITPFERLAQCAIVNGRLGYRDEESSRLQGDAYSKLIGIAVH